MVLPGLLLVLAAGCGGGGHSPGGAPLGPGGSAPVAAQGRVSITIQWPDRSAGALTAQAIPVRTQSVSIRLEDPSNSAVTLAPPAILNRDPNQGGVTQTFPSVRVGQVFVRVRAFDAANAGGSKLAEATGVTNVAKGQTASVGILLAAIARLDITPAPLVVGRGKTAQLSVSARDSAGNLLFVRSDAIQWSSSNSGVATVDQTGRVTGVGPGSATISARDLDPPNSSGTAQVSLDVAPPQIANLVPADLGLTARTNPTIAAKIVDAAPSTGLNTTNALLQLDGAQRVLSLSDLIVQQDGSVTLNYPAPNLAEGQHKVHFEIEDNGGNRASRDWTFSIDTVPPQVSRVRYFTGQVEVLIATDPNTVSFLYDLPPEFRADITDVTAGVNTSANAFTIEVRRIADPNGKPVTDPPRVYTFTSFKPDTADPDHTGAVIFQKSRTDTAPTQAGLYTITITATDTLSNVTPRAPIRFDVVTAG